MPPETRTPFVIVSTLVDDPGAVISVRLEGAFTSVLVRSVPPQDPPYLPYAAVCATDEVRWVHAPFYGVFVGFRSPDLEPGATIPGLHLHGLDRLRTTGGHNNDLRVRDAGLSVGISRDVAMHLPERTMTDLLETPPDMRRVHRALLRSGPRTIAEVATALDLEIDEATRRLEWLADRDCITELPGGLAGPGGEPRWQTAQRAHGTRSPSAMAGLLDSL